MYFFLLHCMTLFQICNLGSGGWAAVYFSKMCCFTPFKRDARLIYTLFYVVFYLNV